MKKTILIITAICSCLIGFSQLSIPPAKGDRFDFFLNGDVWGTEITPQSEFVLKLYVSKDYRFLWIDNLIMSEIRFEELMNYLDDLPDIVVGDITYSAPMGTENWELCSFALYKGKDDSWYYDMKSTPDIYYIMDKIRLKYKN